MEFLHRRGVRGYVTFNTLVFPDELADAGGIPARHHRRRGGRGHRAGRGHLPVDPAAVARFSDPRLHADDRHQRGGRRSSCAIWAASWWCWRANVRSRKSRRSARRSTARARALPLEVFVHGALCVAYSGQCLTSEALGGRSANRGECAQACRMPYELIADGQTVPLGDRRYLLSPQDLAGLDAIAGPGPRGRRLAQDRGPAQSRRSTWRASRGSTAPRSTGCATTRRPSTGERRPTATNWR